MWTQFMDMHSGGRLKEKSYKLIFIEAPRKQAKIIFYNLFGHNPERITCPCCGEDYSISEHEDLAQLTGHERGCRTLATPRGKNGLYKNDDPVIKKKYYLEDGENPPKGYKLSSFAVWGKYQTLKSFIRRKSILIIHKTALNPKHYKG